MNINKILTIGFAILVTGQVSAGEFSWYKMKKNQQESTVSTTVKSIFGSSTDLTEREMKESKVQDRIMKDYNVYSVKKSVKDITADRGKSQFSLGVEYNVREVYSYTDSSSVTRSAKTDAFAVTIKSNTDLTDMGLPGGKLATKVALGNQHIDIDFNKSIIDTETIVINAGLGLKAIHQATPAWEKGFSPYANIEADYDYGSAHASIGARILLDKPQELEKAVAPFFSFSYEF